MSDNFKQTNMNILVGDVGNLPITPKGLTDFCRDYRKHHPDLKDYDPTGMLCSRLEKAAIEMERLIAERDDLRAALKEIVCKSKREPW